jgi:hypothetical protein
LIQSTEKPAEKTAKSRLSGQQGLFEEEKQEQANFVEQIPHHSYFSLGVIILRMFRTLPSFSHSS